MIFKSYRIPDTPSIGKNNRFRNQLWNALKCDCIPQKQFENLAYKKKDLTDLFVTYNTCTNDAYHNAAALPKQDGFNLNFRPGLNISKLSVRNELSNTRDLDFESTLAFRLGIEAESILPFHKNKWALILEPTYQYFRSETTLNTQKVMADYKSIELPAGLRHYFFLGKQAKIFTNATILIDLYMNSEINYEFATNLEIKSKTNFAFGLGYNIRTNIV